jgi:U3 small nucleolar RNA-associated protein 25
MSTDTELKLLTLLNVSAIKKPRDLDIPGGHRGTPPLNSRNTSANASPAPVPVPSPALKGKGKGVNGNANGVKKRKSVIFGGELGPSGSTFGKKAKPEANGKENANGQGKGKGKEVNGNVKNGEVQEKSNGHVDIDLDEGSEDEGATVTCTLSDAAENEANVAGDRFNEHFGAAPELLTSDLISSVDGNEWKSERMSLQGFGRAMELRPSGQAGSSESRTRVSLFPCSVIIS